MSATAKQAQHLETRAVLAAAYLPGQTGHRLTHSLVLVDDVPDHTLCRRITVENLADRFATDVTAAPSCGRCCARRLRWVSP